MRCGQKGSGENAARGPYKALDNYLCCRYAEEQLPCLAPNHLRFRLSSVFAATWRIGRTEPLSNPTTQLVRQLKDLFQEAQQQGSDFFVAVCGYRLAACSKAYGQLLASQQS